MHENYVQCLYADREIRAFKMDVIARVAVQAKQPTEREFMQNALK